MWRDVVHPRAAPQRNVAIDEIPNEGRAVDRLRHRGLQVTRRDGVSLVRNAGIVHQHVDRSAALCLVHGRGHGVAIRHVENLCMRGDAGGAKFANRAIKVLGMTVRKRQDRAFAAECIGNGAADTACLARHEHMLAFQTIGHVSLMSAAPGRCKAAARCTTFARGTASRNEGNVIDLRLTEP